MLNEKFNENIGCDTVHWSVKIDHVIVILPRAKSEGDFLFDYSYYSLIHVNSSVNCFTSMNLPRETSS